MDQAELRETKEVEFGLDLEGRLFLFLLLALLDGEAKLARMMAVKRFLQGDFQGIGLRVTHGHADPRDRLQDDPVPAHRDDERGGDTELKKPSGHVEASLALNHSPARQKPSAIAFVAERFMPRAW